MASQPLPLPEEIIKKAVEAMTVDDGEWRRDDRFACRRCGEPAYLHPYTNLIWGCKTCKLTTYSVFVYFREVSRIEENPLVHQKYPPGTIHEDEEFGTIKVG